MTPAQKSQPTPSNRQKSHATEIDPGVFVGGWKDAESFQGTRFCVLDDAPEEMPTAIHVTIYDGATHRPIVDNLDRLSDLIGAARARNEPVLVFCGHGVRRSPLAGAWYLHRAQGLSLDAAFDRIRSVRPGVEHVKEWAKGWSVLEPVEESKSAPKRSGR
jgi:protein-tyrosine phosphatase